MTRLLIALAALTGLCAVAAASPTPPYAAAAVADKARPAEDVARDVNRKPAEMIVFAGIKPGDVVVDLLPGKGYFTRMFAETVGAKGHVYAYYPSEID
jgi:predicted methyltransferase